MYLLYFIFILNLKETMDKVRLSCYEYLVLNYHLKYSKSVRMRNELEEPGTYLRLYFLHQKLKVPFKGSSDTCDFDGIY